MTLRGWNRRRKEGNSIKLECEGGKFFVDECCEEGTISYIFQKNQQPL